jgi:serine/threonine protein phosphatase PrpC
VKTISAVRAAGDTHPGLQRAVNEDRLHVDIVRGLFIVVDGVGGQAAGGKAADLAIDMLRARLERETGTVVDRVREAITVANNEIRRMASLRPEWRGMACVLTVAVVEDGRAVVGHVGDTRLYKLRQGRIEKVTRDHSPIGEREDAHEISEIEAMRHPRRNEVYRDVGSEIHEPRDPDFIDLHEMPFEPDAALLLCSDGLTDLVDSTTINEVVTQSAGRPSEVVNALIRAANDSGGKDNVTVVYVEGEQFAGNGHNTGAWTFADDRGPSVDVPRRTEPGPKAPGRPGTAGRRRGRWLVRVALVLLLGLVAGYATLPPSLRDPQTWSRVRTWSWSPMATLTPNPGGPIVVTPTQSIAVAMASAPAGSSVMVEPGEYRERLVLRDGVRIVSRVPRGATIRLPSTASEGDPAVVADGVSGAELVGFRIVGDAATPLGTGILARHADVAIVDVEITGAVTVAVDASEGARLTLLASHIHDNPGSALAIRSGASPRVNQNLFSRNGLSERAGAALVIEPDAQPAFFGNVFQGIVPDAFRALGEAAAHVTRDNWFVESPDVQSRPPTTPRGRRGR